MVAITVTVEHMLSSCPTFAMHHPGVTPFDLNTAMASGVFR
jgi:hypothetical protein